MKVLKIIGWGLLLGIVALVAYLAQYGLFASVEISEKNAGPYVLVYQKHIGDYTQVGQIMDNIFKDLKKNQGIAATKGFGFYYDKPGDVDPKKLRSIAGCIVEGQKAEELQKSCKKYTVRAFPVSKSIVAEFPYTGKVSVVIGIFKVYPKLNDYLGKHQYASTPVMEIYDQPNERITYIAPRNVSKEVLDSFLKTDHTE